MPRFEDRRQGSIINDDPMRGPALFSATKALRSQGLGQRRITAVAVQEHGTEKLLKVLRPMHFMPAFISYQPNKWVAVPKPGANTQNSLFAGNKSTFMQSCKSAFLKAYFPLTLAQRCAEWFTLRQFRVTDTNTYIIMSDDAFLVTFMWYSAVDTLRNVH